MTHQVHSILLGLRFHWISVWRAVLASDASSVDLVDDACQDHGTRTDRIRAFIFNGWLASTLRLGDEFFEKFVTERVIYRIVRMPPHAQQAQDPGACQSDDTEEHGDGLPRTSQTPSTPRFRDDEDRCEHIHRSQSDPRNVLSRPVNTQVHQSFPGRPHTQHRHAHALPEQRDAWAVSKRSRNYGTARTRSRSPIAFGQTSPSVYASRLSDHARNDEEKAAVLHQRYRNRGRAMHSGTTRNGKLNETTHYAPAFLAAFNRTKIGHTPAASHAEYPSAYRHPPNYHRCHLRGPSNNAHHGL
ncbi:hypothetical protein M436DRAFT_62390 [Aureobasidium namibiae CBS 147.97]|uniref:Uncharacterized protein n=1 Tax=Aureobasidium namibiae CBS 147.97 TaxID=1043004 RepID=A0A074WTS7_9PEZI